MAASYVAAQPEKVDAVKVGTALLLFLLTQVSTFMVSPLFELAVAIVAVIAMYKLSVVAKGDIFLKVGAYFFILVGFCSFLSLLYLNVLYEPVIAEGESSAGLLGLLDRGAYPVEAYKVTSVFNFISDVAAVVAVGLWLFSTSLKNNLLLVVLLLCSKLYYIGVLVYYALLSYLHLDYSLVQFFFSLLNVLSGFVWVLTAVSLLFLSLSLLSEGGCRTKLLAGLLFLAKGYMGIMLLMYMKSYAWGVMTSCASLGFWIAGSLLLARAIPSLKLAYFYPSWVAVMVCIVFGVLMEGFDVLWFSTDVLPLAMLIGLVALVSLFMVLSILQIQPLFKQVKGATQQLVLLTILACFPALWTVCIFLPYLIEIAGYEYVRIVLDNIFTPTAFLLACFAWYKLVGLVSRAEIVPE